jgi:Flp pilus assembly protein TadG
VKVHVRLRDARGQTLVFFVVLMGGLVLLLAFVLNVGAAANAQRQLQSLADGAALAGVQQLPFDPSAATVVAGQYGSAPSTTLTASFPDGQSITVQASRQVSGLLLPLVTTPTARATATARIEPAESLNNSDLRRVSAPNPRPYLVPLVVSQARACAVASCFGPGAQQTLSLGPGDGSGDFGFMCEGSSCTPGRRGGGGRNALARQLQCQPQSNCLGQTYSTQSGVRAAAPGTATGGQIGAALRNIEGDTLIVPVYSSSSGGYDIAAFAAFVITDVPYWDNANGHQITGYFKTYTIPEHLSYPANTSTNNYGVSVIGLTQ